MSDTGPQLQPCLAEFLRTCVKPNSMVLQVDKIVSQATAASSNNRSPDPKVSKSVTRFYFTDGELTIQALVKPILLADHDLKVGDRILVLDFVVRKAKRLNGGGKVLYLGVQEFEILIQQKSADWEGEGGFVKSDNEAHLTTPSRKRRQRNETQVSSAGVGHEPPLKMDKNQSNENRTNRPERARAQLDGEDAEREDFFESIDVDLQVIEKRRQTLQTFRRTRSTQADTSDSESNGLQKSNASAGTTNDDSKLITVERPNRPNDTNETTGSMGFHRYKTSGTTRELPSRAALQFFPHHNPLPLTPPYHPLSALLNPSLPSKNYPLTTLAIITYTSPSLLSKPNSPFPPKRHLKLLDPSLPPSVYQGITLAVYVDARSFLPKPGTLALFRGIVMQKFGREVILNAYASLRDKPENEKWFVDDEGQLESMGFDVKGMRRWWEDKSNRKRT